MRTSPSANSGAKRWWFSALAMLAMVAQMGVALAPLAEGRPGPSMSSHIEAPGAHGHYTHDEATCAACQARSIQGTTSRPALPALDNVEAPTQLSRSVDRVVSSGVHLHANPRAPPSVI